jgi:hypothetical protein
LTNFPVEALRPRLPPEPFPAIALSSLSRVQTDCTRTDAC